MSFILHSIKTQNCDDVSNVWSFYRTCLQSTKYGLRNPDGTDDGRLREISDTLEGKIFRATDGILTALPAPTTAVVAEKSEISTVQVCEYRLGLFFTFNLSHYPWKLTSFEQDEAFELRRQSVVWKKTSERLIQSPRRKLVFHNEAQDNASIFQIPLVHQII